MIKLAALLVNPHDPAEFIISEAEGAAQIHTGVILEDGEMVFADCRRGVVKEFVDTSDVTRWLVIDLPGWGMTDDCMAWIKSTIGKPYNWLGLFSAIAGKGIGLVGWFFCSQHSGELLSRLKNGPQGLPPLACPSVLVRLVLNLVAPHIVTAADRPQNFGPLQDYLLALILPTIYGQAESRKTGGFLDQTDAAMASLQAMSDFGTAAIKQLAPAAADVLSQARAMFDSGDSAIARIAPLAVVVLTNLNAFLERISGK